MKVKRLDVKNLKKIISATLEFAEDQPVIRISGKNSQGKTSLLTALWGAIGGKTAVTERGQDAGNLVREGEKKAEVQVTLAGLSKEVRVQWSVTQAGTEQLNVWSSDGSKVGRKELSALLSQYTIDPLSFVSLTKSQQYDEVCRLCGIDVTSEKAAIENAKRELSLANDIARRAPQVIAQSPDCMPRIDTTAIKSRIQLAHTIAQSIAQVRQRKAVAKSNIEQIDNEIVRLEATILSLKNKRATLAQAITEVEPQEINVENELKALSDAEASNRLVDEYERIQAQNKIALKAQEEATQKRAAVADAEKKFREKVSSTKLPIPGLTIDEQDGISVEGKPFGNLSSSEQIIFATRLAAAANPELRVINIKDGSLLDEDMMASLAQVAEDEGMQIFIERVGEEKDSIIIRDGEVVPNN